MPYLPGSTCAVSVIISMYNAEKYIGKCFDSLLNQRFQDFEVIVVDDCSTDKSAEIVDGYTPKFNERLMFIGTRKNSGGKGYVPRNLGLKLANGEYVFFANSDDFIAKNALETLYHAAKNNDADVVYTAAYNDIRKPKDIRLVQDDACKKLSEEELKNEGLVIDEAADKNLHNLFISGMFHAPWTKLVRRDLLLENKIVFPELVTGGDSIWSLNVCCHAKKILCLPEPLYFWRHYNAGRVTRPKETSSEQISYVVSNFIAWLKALQELSSKTEFLKDNPDYCYSLAASTFEQRLALISEAIRPLRSNDVHDLLYRELGAEDAAFRLMVSILFSELIRRDKNSKVLQGKVVKLTNELEQLKRKG